MDTKMQKNKESQTGWYKTSIATTKEENHVITQRGELDLL